MLVNIVDAHIVFDLCITPYPLLLSKLYLYIDKYILFDMIFLIFWRILVILLLD